MTYLVSANLYSVSYNISQDWRVEMSEGKQTSANVTSIQKLLLEKHRRVDSDTDSKYGKKCKGNFHICTCISR